MEYGLIAIGILDYMGSPEAQGGPPCFSSSYKVKNCIVLYCDELYIVVVLFNNYKYPSKTGFSSIISIRKIYMRHICIEALVDLHENRRS